MIFVGDVHPGPNPAERKAGALTPTISKDLLDIYQLIGEALRIHRNGQ